MVENNSERLSCSCSERVYSRIHTFLPNIPISTTWDTDNYKHTNINNSAVLIQKKKKTIIYNNYPLSNLCKLHSLVLWRRGENMKFWKILSNLIEETLPEWRDKFLSYKDLKKQLKLIYPTHQPNNKRRRLDHPTSTADEETETQVSKELVDFLRLLEVEIDKFNAFFVDKEEEYVIRWKVMCFFLSFRNMGNWGIVCLWVLSCLECYGGLSFSLRAFACLGY